MIERNFTKVVKFVLQTCIPLSSTTQEHQLTSGHFIKIDYHWFLQELNGNSSELSQLICNTAVKLEFTI